MERKIQHSKSLVRVMFAGNAAGQYLPPMVVYKSESICREWVSGGGGGGGGNDKCFL